MQIRLHIDDGEYLVWSRYCNEDLLRKKANRVKNLFFWQLKKLLPLELWIKVFRYLYRETLRDSIGDVFIETYDTWLTRKHKIVVPGGFFMGKCAHVSDSYYDDRLCYNCKQKSFILTI